MKMICGIDEAGRGPVIGPLIVCGVKVENDDFFRSLGVKDSKKLTRSQREILSEKIEKVTDGIEIIEISAREIDLIREEMTLNQLEVKIFASLITKLCPDIAYVDSADTDESRFGREVQAELDLSVEIISKHRADEMFPVVSAASIMAKIHRDRRVHEIEEEIGENIGSGYPSDPTTVRFMESWLDRYGELPPHSRKSWDTCSRMLRMKSLKRIDDF